MFMASTQLMSGSCISIRMRSIFFPSPVNLIALTALEMKGDEEKYLRIGSDAYQSKPVDKKIQGLLSSVLTKKKDFL